uniref:Homeodomain phBC6A51-type domain-containing protein n=1 Tax=viral metagenome TaxID=1070528 RepID=A0A6H1ZS14_9ZZZZ
MARPATKRNLLIKEYAEWLVAPLGERVPATQEEFAEKAGVSNVTLYAWKKRIIAEGETDKEKIDSFMEQVYTQAMKPNATAKHMELFAILKGLKVDKSEHKVEFNLSADDYFRVRQEARRRAGKVHRVPDGDRGVLPEPALLHDEVRVDREQEHGEDSEVGSVAFPDGTP